MFWRFVRLISDESIHVCKLESKTYMKIKHRSIQKSCFCRPDVHFQWRTALISWGHFIFSSWWLTVLIATVHTFKWMKNLKTILDCWIIATRCYLKKGLEKGLQNKTKKELEMFVVSYPNISPSFILILNRMERKQ